MNQRGFTPLIILIGILVLVVLAGVVYFWYQNQTSVNNSNLNSITNYNKGTNNLNSQNSSSSAQTIALPLTITQPSDGSVSQRSSIKVTGITIPYIKVYVNDISTTSDASGSFSASVTLEPGSNYINIYLYDDQGNYAQQELTVVYQGS